MKPSTLIAVQFALWAFFLSGLIPFSGDFLLPIIWIYDKRVFIAYGVAFSLEIVRTLPFVISLIPLRFLNLMPTWMIPFLAPFTFADSLGGMLFTTSISAFFLRRKLKKKAPDLISLAS